MESATKPLKINYTIMTKIKRIWEEFAKQYVSGFGNDAVLNEVSRGWYVAFEGSYEALFFGFSPPEGWGVGDTIKITFEKTNG